MSTILQIDSSPRAASISSALAAKFVEGLKKKDPSAVVYHHNTTNEKLPYVDESALGTLFAGIEPTDEAQKQLLALSEKLIEEFLAADEVVVAVPMWNLGIPASLKAWVDLISRPGRTFKYVAGGGVETLVQPGKKVVVIASRGGAYPEGSPWAAYNQVDPYLRTIFAFFGVTDVNFVYVDNQNRSGDAPAEGLAAAEKQIAALIG
jgi:FMN-dependent NADH-azoreductase